MSCVLIFWFFIIISGFISSNSADSNEYSLCNEENFKQYLLKRSVNAIRLTELRRRCNATYSSRCNVPPAPRVYYFLKEDMKTGRYFLRVVAKDINARFLDSGCWGIGFEQSTNEETFGYQFRSLIYRKIDIQYISKKDLIRENRTKIEFDLYFKPAFNYTLTVMALPSGKMYEFYWKAPDRCEVLVITNVLQKLVDKYIYRNICLSHLDLHDCFATYADFSHNGTYYIFDSHSRNERGLSVADGKLCLLKFADRHLTSYHASSKHQLRNKEDLQQNHDFAKKFCDKYQNLPNFYEILKTRLDIQDCVPILRDPLEEIEDGSSTVSTISIVAIILFIVVVILAVIAKKYNVRFCQKSNFKRTPFSTHNNDYPTVMIVQRAGCEILEKIVLEFASFLRSYGVIVKLAGSEDCLLDAEGGIGSFLHNNINLCDYVFIMITQFEGSQMKQKHRSYEFAMKMMEGTVVHNCAHTQYIPMYMMPYNKAVQYFPPFLKASTYNGYQIPNSALNLVNKLFIVRDRTKERKIKNKEFVENLKIYTRQYLCATHSSCNKEYCSKGLHCHISDNMSSVWATTIHPRWGSTGSFSSCSIDLIERSEIEKNGDKDVPQNNFMKDDICHNNVLTFGQHKHESLDDITNNADIQDSQESFLPSETCDG